VAGVFLKGKGQVWITARDTACWPRANQHQSWMDREAASWVSKWPLLWRLQAFGLVRSCAGARLDLEKKLQVKTHDIQFRLLMFIKPMER